MKECGIYCIENKVNNKKYIGESTNIHRRIQKHIWLLNHNEHPSEDFNIDWNNYGKENFKFYTIEICEKKNLRKEEAKWIKYYNTTNSEYGYNLLGCMRYGVEASEKQRKRASEILIREYKNNPERFKKAGASIRMTYENHPEKRERQSKIMKERMNHPECKEKIRQSSTGRHRTEDGKKRISEARSKKVLCIETGVIYKSATEANNLNNLTCVHKAANGYQATAGGYHWKYV